MPLWVVCEGEPSKFWHYYWDADELPARKFYSFIAEIGHRLRHFMSDPNALQMLTYCEQCAEGKITEDDISDLSEQLRPQDRERTLLQQYVDGLYFWVADRYKVSADSIHPAAETFAIEECIKAGVLRVDSGNEEVVACYGHPLFASVRERTELEWGAIVRCIYGPNPFVPQPFSPVWRTEHTTGIASKMYEERDFAPMPILADALEEAGCDNADILTHCREPGVHVRGCWVVDLVLGK